MMIFNFVTVGTSKKRKQSSAVKAEKQNAKRQAVASTSSSSSTVKCKSCKEVGHSSSNSKNCKNHNPTKKDVLLTNLGENYQAFNRKAPFDTLVKQEFKTNLRNKILESSRYIRQIMIRAMMFTNFYMINDVDDATNSIFQQNYWYSVCQLVNGRKVTNGKMTPPAMMTKWTSFKNTYANAVYNPNLPTGASSCLSSACVEAATIYTNHIVENFEIRLLKFLKYRLQNKFAVR